MGTVGEAPLPFTYFTLVGVMALPGLAGTADCLLVA